MQQLFDQIADDVSKLPIAALQLVGAFVLLQEAMPPALIRFVMDQMGQRAAVAVVRISADATYSAMEFARHAFTGAHTTSPMTGILASRNSVLN